MKMTTTISQTQSTTVDHQCAGFDCKDHNDAATLCHSDDQVNVLLESLDVLTRLAEIDSTIYQRTLVSTYAETSPNNAAGLQRRLDELQRHWKFEETPVPRLIDSIHRLHSTCLRFESYVDRLTEENDKLQGEILLSARRMSKLEAGIQKIYKKNQKLKNKIQSTYSKKQSIFNNVRDYIKDIQRSDIDILKTQLVAHERIVGNRIRTESQDTFDSFKTVATDQLSDDVGSAAGSAVSSVSSVPSVIMDEGLATIKFDAKPEDLVLQYPADRRVGIQFHNMKVRKTSYNSLSRSVKNDHDEIGSTGGGFPALNFQFDKIFGNGKKEVEEEKEETAFFVVGHFGFDETLNIHRPPIGARLVSVNGVEIGTGITLQKIRMMIRGNPFSLSFRLDDFTVKEREEVEKVAKETFETRSKPEQGRESNSTPKIVAATTVSVRQTPTKHKVTASITDEMLEDTVRTGNVRTCVHYPGARTR